MILPRLRSYLTPFIEINKLKPNGKNALAKGTYPDLDAEAVRALEFIRPIFAIDPSVHINRFLNLLPTHTAVF